MCDSDDLLSGSSIVSQKRRISSFKTALRPRTFLIGNNIAIFTSTQNRFDFQHISDHSDTSLDSSGTGKIFQIADGENTVHFANIGFQKICRFVYVHAPIAHLAGIDGEDALCKRGIQGIDEADFTFSAVFFKKLLCSKSCGVISSADVFA